MLQGLQGRIQGQGCSTVCRAKGALLCSAKGLHNSANSGPGLQGRSPKSSVTALLCSAK
jgi:hypothetical protein